VPSLTPVYAMRRDPPNQPWRSRSRHSASPIRLVASHTGSPMLTVRVSYTDSPGLSYIDWPTQNMIDHRTVVERSYQNDHVRRIIIHRSCSNRSYGYGKRSRAIDRQRTFGDERQLIVSRTIL